MKRSLRSPSEALPEIDTSIVLATCSRAHLLRGALESLHKEAVACGKPVEFVIVDDGSQDETPHLLLDWKKTASVSVTLVLGKRGGIAAARNLGAEHAQGKWLASFDDDQIALAGWLTALRQLADDMGVPCVGGSLELSLPAGVDHSSLGARVRRVLGEQLDGDIPKKSTLPPASNNVLIRRDVFLELGGYDISFTEGAEDTDLFDRMSRAGHEIWFQPNARALHITPQSRLQEGNLRWTSVRLGASKARQLARRGSMALWKSATFRIAVFALRDLPQFAWAAVSRNKRLLVDVECSMWYTKGLLRALPAFLRANDGQSPFLRSLDFRARNGERNEFTQSRKPD